MSRGRRTLGQKPDPGDSGRGMRLTGKPFPVARTSGVSEPTAGIPKCAMPERVAKPWAGSEDLARVHDVVGVEGGLDGAHHRECLAMLDLQELLLAEAHAMLAAGGAAEGQ
jgi:hypothetical protein